MQISSNIVNGSKSNN